MKSTKWLGAAALGAGMLLGLSAAQAGYVATLTQQGPNVVATGSGPIDLTGLRFSFSDSIGGQLIPNEGSVFTGPVAAEDSYTGISGPTSFGVGGQTNPTSNSGDIAGVNGTPAGDQLVEVPHGYVSGNLSDMSPMPGRPSAASA